MAIPIKQFSKDNKYYNLYVYPTLFGDFSLVCSWGSKNSKRGGRKVFFFQSQDELNKKIDVITRKRISRNYYLVSL